MYDNSHLQRLLKAKIPCKETGIEVKQTICDICAPSFHCGIDAYVKDGKVIKIEGTKEHPVNKGLLCTKGLSNRQYIYREDRIRTPLRRVGKRGSGEFEQIKWEEAYQIISERLLDIKDKYGPESVVFFSGYSKWYRPFLHRFAYSFGSPNYATESSTCMTSTFMAWDIATGHFTVGNVANAGVFLGWAFNPYYSRYLALIPVEERKKKGMKVIIIDPRETVASQRLADIHLRPIPGTDGALALGMGKILIDNDWIDKEYIEKHVFGYEEYKEYVQQFDIDTVAKITGVCQKDIVAAVEMMANNGPMTINESAAPIAHHKNGLQNYRAIMALSALTGNYDRLGGQIPFTFTYNYMGAGFATKEEEFIKEVKPKGARPKIGAERFPLWNELVDECQATDIIRQVEEEKPYPVKAIFALGMNKRMLPDSRGFHKALEKLDFIVDTDLFFTDTAKMSDIVLPACSSFERGELKAYAGGYLFYTKPVIEPLYDSRDDVRILSELAREMNLGDALLESGYEECIKYILRDVNITLDELKSRDYPVRISDAKPYVEREYTRKGYNTPSGKFELYSNIIAKYEGLDPLPTYTESLNEWDKELYPLILTSAPRIPSGLHSRLHDVKWVRSLRPEPLLEISSKDAEEMGLSQGEEVELYTPNAFITVKVKITHKNLYRVAHMYHGYREADVNLLMDRDNLDPYSGFPGFRTTRCAIRKKVTK
jgi:anaerobic selenocysteine-containing dehydrogenase